MTLSLFSILYFELNNEKHRLFLRIRVYLLTSFDYALSCTRILLAPTAATDYSYNPLLSFGFNFYLPLVLVAAFWTAYQNFVYHFAHLNIKSM